MADRGAALPAPERIAHGEFEGALRIGSKDGVDVYWYVPRNQLVEAPSPDRDPDAAEAHRLSAETVGEYIHRTERDGSLWSLNELGEFFRNVAAFHDVRILTVRQEEAYALCRVSGMPRPTAAELLGVSESLLDDHLATVQKKITCAFNLVEAVNRH
ncbi:MAG: hypothetical protein ACOC0Z_02800 [Halohasta sp.]